MNSDHEQLSDWIDRNWDNHIHQLAIQFPAEACSCSYCSNMKQLYLGKDTLNIKPDNFTMWRQLSFRTKRVFWVCVDPQVNLQADRLQALPIWLVDRLQSYAISCDWKQNYTSAILCRNDNDGFTIWRSVLALSHCDWHGMTAHLRRWWLFRRRGWLKGNVTDVINWPFYVWLI